MASAQFPQSLLTKLRPDLNFFYHDEPPVFGRMGVFTPQWYSCWWLEEGSVEVEMAGSGSLRAKAGQWMLLQPWVRRNQAFRPGTRIVSVAFRWRMPPGWEGRANLPKVLKGCEAPGLWPAAEQMLKATGGGRRLESNERRYTLEQWLGLNARLQDFVAVWCEVVGWEWNRVGGEQADGRLGKAREILETFGQVGPVPYGKLREATGLGAAQLNRLFRHQLETTPKAELNRICLERAIGWLADPQQSIKTMAYELGFTDSSHFAKWFARQTGMSPGDYRRGMWL